MGEASAEHIPEPDDKGIRLADNLARLRKPKQTGEIDRFIQEGQERLRRQIESHKQEIARLEEVLDDTDALRQTAEAVIRERERLESLRARQRRG